jgi:uncharacterized membrane protein YhaH (DUF805 family)
MPSFIRAASANNIKGVRTLLQQLRRLLLSFQGRIPRSTFWWGSLCLGVVFVVLLTVLEQGFGRASPLILYPPVFWAVAALATKRLHDRGKSPFWFLLLLIPLLGPLWLFIDLYFRRGTPGENQYGPDSLDRAGDYLTVN